MEESRLGHRAARSAHGHFASDPEYREELPDAVGAGQLVQGWAGSEVPPEAGMLEFPYGPSTYYVMVEPPT